MKIFISAGFATAVLGSLRPERNALPVEIFRETVEPAKGGKVPEAARLRAELNRIDSIGLRDPEGVRMANLMAEESPELLDNMLQVTNSQLQPGLTPAIRLRPEYHPELPLLPGQTLPPFHQPPYSPPPPYTPSPYTPTPYHPPPPVGPVLLKTRPYEVKSVQPLPITVADTYTGFDCRAKHPGRHYADVETGCEVYHYCHEDGKQDTFKCGYGTVFNEYIGTCDFINSVPCVPGNGYAPKPVHQPHPVPHHPPPPAHHHPRPAPYTPHKPFIHIPPPVKKLSPYKKTPYGPSLIPSQLTQPYKNQAPYKKPSIPIPHKPKPYQHLTHHKPATHHHPTLTHHTPTSKTLADPIKPFTHFG